MRDAWCVLENAGVRAHWAGRLAGDGMELQEGQQQVKVARQLKVQPSRAMTTEACGRGW